MNTETNSVAADLRRILARAQASGSPPGNMFGLVGTLAELRALEALVSAGEQVATFGAADEVRVIIQVPHSLPMDDAGRARVAQIAESARTAVLDETQPVMRPKRDGLRYDKTPLREVLRQAVEAADEFPGQAATSNLALTATNAEWKALEALVSAGEDDQTAKMVRLAIEEGADKSHPGTWTPKKALGYVWWRFP